MQKLSRMAFILLCIFSIMFAGLLYLPDRMGAISMLISFASFFLICVFLIWNRTVLIDQRKYVLFYLLLLIVIPMHKLKYYKISTFELLAYIIPYSIILCILVQIALMNRKEGSTLYSRYQIIQHALEKEFGNPGYHPLRSLLNLLNPDGTIMRWKKQGLIIEHSLQDRFGMEENVSITIL